MIGEVRGKTLRKRRSAFVVFVSLLVAFFAGTGWFQASQSDVGSEVLSNTTTATSELASDVLNRIVVKGRAPKTNYSRAEFGDGWASIDGCDMRNRMLATTMSEVEFADDGCTVLSGILQDVYTAKTISFKRGENTSDLVQIDHVVALSDAWQKGAQGLSFERRIAFANDPLNLLAVDGKANQDKGDSDAASWVPPNKAYRCRYVARQIAVKAKYSLWVTQAEKAAMISTLGGCGEQRVPIEQ
jgi:hypothetical protein